MTKRTDVALLAENDQLRTAMREALRLMDLGALGVTCKSCGSKVKVPCYGDGPLPQPHDIRSTEALEKLRSTLSEPLIGKREKA